MKRIFRRRFFTNAAISLALPCLFVPPAPSAEAPTVRAQLKAEKDRTPAPGFALQDAAGKAVRLSDYKGKVVLLNFWATWCGGCKVEIPWFQEFETTLGPRHFAVLGVSTDEEGWKAVKPYIEKTKISYRMALADKATPDQYGFTAMPATFLIDGKGRIAATYIGLVDRNDVELNLRRLLDKR